MSVRGWIISLAHELSEENNAAFDLWTWLPSYREALKHHGDYASEFTPSPTDVMREATMYISHDSCPTEEQRKEAQGYYDCPCGEDHGGTEEEQ